MAKLALSLLGKPHVERDGVPIEINRRKTIALLTYLAVTGEPHHRDKLAALFWPRFPRDRARAALRKTLTEVRHAIGQEWIDTEGETVGLRFNDGLWLDVQQFNSLLSRLDEQSGRADGEDLDQLKQVVDLYRSDFLSEFLLDSNSTFSEWQYFQTEGLRKRVVSTLDRLVEGHIKGGEHGLAIAYARRRLGLDPIDETAHRRLIRLYAATGQYSSAIRQYRECCRRLEREIGVTPDEKTEQLYRDVVARRPVTPQEPQEPGAHRQPERGPAGQQVVRIGFGFSAFLRSPLGIGTLFLAVVALAAGIYFSVTAMAMARVRTITVFPLEDISIDKAADPFALLMADALTSELSKTPRIQVRAGGRALRGIASSAASFRDSALSMGASYYLTGSVFRVESRVLVSLRLVDARHDDTVLWGEGYERSLENTLATGKSIAAESVQQVAHILGLQ